MRSSALSRTVDSVVMLTWSDWKTEMRSNRYHYATRLARHLPVIFVQPDAPPGSPWSVEEVQGHRITILHVSPNYGPEQDRHLKDAFLSLGVRAPLLWIYNCNFVDFIESTFAPIKLYHATEDYFCDDFVYDDSLAPLLRRTLRGCDVLLSVSEGVEENFLTKGGFRGRSIVLTNGVDFAFWSESPKPRGLWLRRPLAIYQGGISRKIDFSLMTEVARRLPDWDFAFCGKIFESADDLEHICTLPNVTYKGNLTVEGVRALAGKADVGLIPFVQNDWIVRRSFPLKTFEYMAAGLPVISVPIESVLRHTGPITFASDADEFVAGLQAGLHHRHDKAERETRVELARLQDYDLKFSRLLEVLEETAAQFLSSSPRAHAEDEFRVLVLCDIGSSTVKTVAEHLRSFETHSRHRIFYNHATADAVCHADLSLFDAVVLHYSVRLSFTGHLSPSFQQALREYRGLKVMFIQDEYDQVENTRQALERYGAHVVFTCVPEAHVERVYPRSRFPFVRFVGNLTGYVPEKLPAKSIERPPSERQLVIAYRGRELPYWYGDLGQEKLEIGRKMRQICETRGVPVDIEWTNDKRIYGDRWYDFLASARATLGTESGSNLFDFDGQLVQSITRAQAANPDLTYAEAKRRFFSKRDDDIEMNQVSPKIFEAIACRTALVLFEGTYSGVVEPHRHFIPLKKDFSNVDEVLTKLNDGRLLDEMTERAHEEILRSGKYDYRSFIAIFDKVLEAHLLGPRSGLTAGWLMVYDGQGRPMGHAAGACDFNTIQGLAAIPKSSGPAPAEAAHTKILRDLADRSRLLEDGGPLPAPAPLIVYVPEKRAPRDLHPARVAKKIVKRIGGQLLTWLAWLVSRRTGRYPEDIRGEMVEFVRRWIRVVRMQ